MLIFMSSALKTWGFPNFPFAIPFPRARPVSFALPAERNGNGTLAILRMTLCSIVFRGVACLFPAFHSRIHLFPLTLTSSGSVVKIMSSSDSLSPVYTILTAPTWLHFDLLVSLSSYFLFLCLVCLFSSMLRRVCCIFDRLLYRATLGASSLTVSLDFALGF